MDPFFKKTQHLNDIARAQAADAGELNEIAEILSAELAKRSKMIQSLKNEHADISRSAVEDASRAFWIGLCSGSIIGAAVASLTLLFRI